MAKAKNPIEDDPEDMSRVKRIDEEALSWKNVLRIKRDIRKADKEQADIQKALKSLTAEQLKDVKDYQKNTDQISNNLKKQQKLQAEIADAPFYKKDSLKDSLKNAQKQLATYQETRKELEKTSAVSLSKMAKESAKKEKMLQTEKALIKGINAERSIGGKIMDLFRSKEQKQAQIDIARAKAGGGVNPAAEAGGTGAAGGPEGRSDFSKAMVGLYQGVEKATKAINSGLNKALAGAAALLTGNSIGMGGGAVSSSGVSSILGGFEKLITTIPFVGGLLGGLVGIFKSLVEAALGVDQANMRVARSMNISKDAATEMRESFKQAANAQDNIVVNETRMLQSQIEIGNQLGINQELSKEMLINDVKLRDITGLEAESRQAIAQSQIITGRKAEEITKSVIGQVGAFNKMVGTGFKFSSILQEASKLSGVMGLTFSKYPEKILRATMGVKTMGLEMANLNGISDSLLDFESSISKEMEAQVLTGMDLNLTKAREAALNNDYVGVAREITKNVGSTANFLGMNRIKQEGIAVAMGMTADSLADVLKKQDMYTKLGATDLKTAQTRIALMEKEKGGREKISALIGKDGYEMITGITTAERLTEVMEKIKRVFVEFVNSSGLLDFLTSPEKMGNFIKSVTQKLASTISLIGDIIATLLEGIGALPGTNEDKWQGLANQVRSGTGGFANSISSVGISAGNAVGSSIGETVQQGATQKTAAAAVPAATYGQPYGMTAPQPITVNMVVDGNTLSSTAFQYAPQQHSLNTK